MITISAFKWVPDFAQGQVRDLRARWALEEAGLPYRTRLLAQGDQDKADSVYAGVAEPLTADDIADCVAWAATRPHHVNIDRLVVRPIAQAAQHKVHRES